MSSSALLHHPTLSVKLLGKQFRDSTTTQYRNLKYATVPGRWQDSVPLRNLKSHADLKTGVYNATAFGPSCPHKRGAQAWDVSLIGDVNLETEPGQGVDENMDEFECLHVNVTVPKGLNGKDPIPVFAWVHGGGLSMGSNSWPQYDLRRFVERSVEIGKPIIGVSINYRTNVFGFLASKDITSTGNYGYKDQVLAFLWIREHIAGFCGDPNNVTAAGESAGGISLSTLLCAELDPDKSLFDRVVIMSGEVSLRKPRGWRWHEEMYKDQSKYLNRDKSKTLGHSRLLMELGAEELAQRLPLAQHFCGLVDGVWLNTDGNIGVLGDGSNEVHKRHWCKDFVVGDTADDGTVLKGRILDNPAALTRLQALCAQHLSKSEMAALFSAYNIPTQSSSSWSPPKDSRELPQALRNLASELRFYLPALTVHSGWKAHHPHGRVGRYHFHLQNPINGTFHGLSSHELDVAFLLQNFNHYFDAHCQNAAKQMADHFIGFTNGEKWSADGGVVVFSDFSKAKKVQVFEEDDYDDIFRSGRGRVLRAIGAVKLWQIAEGWQEVRADIEDEHSRKVSRL
ncbi:para-nitrobenzyl esterase [Aaosphaeria arxii CBS 175.79]|uniref:Para-nitrobenzyl esterase n=1 Tax=Aaosphaeria arxii CBS 175.79 TaxID=1450172 RepID=A0A6A5XA58_9PLEO|nr:para-nitrobenzyl esterase [Aaosphaeria arxii CBS 175.79]KAF2009823.1 para-nitrobenzyl esterase [Aaosphaeria arxii CBS 175.79]